MKITSIFSFSHSDFKRLVLQTCKNKGLFGEEGFAYLKFYAISTVFQLFNSDSSQIHVSWTIFNQYLTSPLSWHWWASHSAVIIILSAKEESHFYQF